MPDKPKPPTYGIEFPWRTVIIRTVQIGGAITVGIGALLANAARHYVEEERDKKRPHWTDANRWDRD